MSPNREEQDMNEEQIEELINSIKNINKQAVLVYTPIVEDVCSRSDISKEELELLLDYMVSICVSDEMTELFRKVCRKFYYQYPDTIAEHILFYREMFDNNGIQDQDDCDR